MMISAIRPNVNRVNFKSVQEYENPVNRKTERNLTVLSTAGIGAVTGLTAAGITTCFKNGWKLPALVGSIVGAATIALLLPSKLYNTKLNAFAKEKEMGVFSVQKEAQRNIYDEIHKETQDENVSLDQKIDHYATVKVADNGKALMVK